MSEKINDKLQEAINEAVLKAAFTEAAEQEIAELEAMDIEVPQPKEKQRKEVEKAIRDKKRGNSQVWRAVAMIAIVFCVAASIIMIQPTVRASVWDFVVSFYEKYLSFDFDEEELTVQYDFGEYQITYVPKDYILSESQSNALKTKMILVNGQDTISLTLYMTSFSLSNNDIEGGQSQKITVGMNSGYMITYEDRDMKELVFGDNSHMIMIRGTISEKELKKIAENIK